MHFSAKSCRSISRVFAALTIFIGLLVMVGWVFHVSGLKTVFPGYVNMKVNTALGFVFCGTALFLALQEPTAWRKRMGAALCGIVVVASLATLLEYLFTVDLHIDQIFFRDFPMTAGTSNPGRPAPNTAFVFLLVAIAIFALPRGTRGVLMAQVIAILCFFNVLIPAVGYFFHAQLFITVFSLTRLAVHTIIGFYFLIFGILLARIGEGFTGVFLAENAAGYVSRKLLLPVIFAPPLIGWICYLGFDGHLYDLGFLCSLFVFCTTAVIFILTALTITALQKSEMEREALRISETAARISEQSALEATRLKSNFLAMMSHEVRTPMNSVLGYASLLRRTPLNDEQSEYVAMINSSGDLLLRVVDDVLDHSCIESGRLQVLAEEFNPVAVTKSIGDQFRPAAKEKGLELDILIPPDVPIVVIGDEKRLRQILTNLVSNAIKFTSAGRITVSLKQKHSSEGGGRIRLDFQVEDTGGGIKPEDIDKLFKPFSQVDLGRHQRVSSSGLGLAISKQLVELMGGAISLSSQYRIGSQFHFHILVGEVVGEAASKVESVSGALADAALPGRPLEILIAEDDRATQLLMRHLLKKLGANPQFANDGEEAVRRAGEHPWDVVFMDVNLPFIDGLEATRRIRRAEASSGKRMKIIGLTANIFDDQDVRFRDAGMDECLLKPINYDKFSTLLASFVT